MEDDEEYEEMQQAYYDDGNFADDGGYDSQDSYDDEIPTYDELELEGRYYNYGSREEYNQWRQEQIKFKRSNPTAYNQASSSGTGCLGFIVMAVIAILILMI